MSDNVKKSLINLFDEPYYFVKYYFILLLFQSLFFFDPKLQNNLNYIFILWGSGIMFYHSIISKEYLKIKGLYLFFASWFVAAITIFINREAGNLVYSLKTIYLTLLVYFIFYTFFKITKKNKYEALYNISKPLVILQLIFGIISLALYFYNVAGYIERSDVGFYWGIRYIFRLSGTINPLLAGVYNDPNYAVVIMYISIILSFIMLNYNKTSSILKKILWFNIFIEFYMIILSNSRAAHLGLIVSLVIVAFIFFYKKKNNKLNNKYYLTQIISFTIFIGIVLFLGDSIRQYSYKILERPITRITVTLPNAKIEDDLTDEFINTNKVNIYKKVGPLKSNFVGLYPSYFKHLFDEYPQDELIVNEKVYDRISQNKEDTDTTDIQQAGNGRVGRWLESIKLVTRHRPLTGTSSRGVQYFAKKYSSESEPFRRLVEGQDPVNSYLRYLLHYGWISFILLIIFGATIFINIIRRLILEKYVDFNYILMVGLASYLLVISVFLSALIDVCSYYSCTLAFSLSYLNFGPIKTKESK